MVYPVMHNAFLLVNENVKIHWRAGYEEHEYEPGGVMGVEGNLHRVALIPVFYLSNVP